MFEASRYVETDASEGSKEFNRDSSVMGLWTSVAGEDDSIVNTSDSDCGSGESTSSKRGCISVDIAAGDSKADLMDSAVGSSAVSSDDKWGTSSEVTRASDGANLPVPTSRGKESVVSAFDINGSGDCVSAVVGFGTDDEENDSMSKISSFEKFITGHAPEETVDSGSTGSISVGCDSEKITCELMGPSSWISITPDE